MQPPIQKEAKDEKTGKSVVTGSTEEAANAAEALTPFSQNSSNVDVLQSCVIRMNQGSVNEIRAVQHQLVRTRLI